MSSSTGNGWAQLRQQTRTLESQTEGYFHKYSQFSQATAIPPKPTEDEKQTEATIQDLLEKREALITQLTRLLDSESPLTTSALKSNNLTRHREILLDHRRELVRLKASITDARQRANLLSNVRSDISAYRNSNPADAEADYMLDERNRIDRSHTVADGVLSQAYAINESFGTQRETLASVNRRIVGAASQVPGLNSLIGRIGAKKRRDGIILGSFIAFCCLLLFFLM
ncbi:hypothetical protein HO133_002639 [Letharia lupina]|uniref:Golgi SNAP receptor complex member 1 n=2 Tax=Letharia TaxID=112415 RepID=A0A8H6CCT9_9LECA|nr:uncharacterized protein HO133_002639 [Letharia lupina]XP_037166049.1 uncharacterized protein HO173_005007 [Letharia columbiana]KAF6220958.1 hypothetical protein HO133_002639 [Letharia lupina]KAF6236716.1 hypothetical protein HO173_005007 [Letharia columbiana]